jgi:hypothetical protein
VPHAFIKGISAPRNKSTVTLTAGSYKASGTFSGGWASFSVPAGSLPAGTNTLTISYGGDTTYVAGAGSAQVTVTP